MKILSQFGLIMVIFLITITRVHYCIDLWGGYLVTHSLFLYHKKIAIFMDRVLSFPYVIFDKIRKRYEV